MTTEGVTIRYRATDSNADGMASMNARSRLALTTWTIRHSNYAHAAQLVAILRLRGANIAFATPKARASCFRPVSQIHRAISVPASLRRRIRRLHLPCRCRIPHLGRMDRGRRRGIPVQPARHSEARIPLCEPRKQYVPRSGGACRRLESQSPERFREGRLQSGTRRAKLPVLISSHRMMADCLDPVAVGIPEERGAIRGVIAAQARRERR